VPFSSGVERALRASIAAHTGQSRKGQPDLPYIVHPVHVAMMLARLGADDETIQAGLLHDVVEDCEGWTLARIEAQFGARVRAIVADLTEEQGRSWEERKLAGIEHAAHMLPESATIKAVDKLHNLSSLLSDLRAADDPAQVWSHFSRGAAETIAMSARLVEALRARVDPRLADSLARVLDGLRAASRV
jgi:(p)ppGpp synthase/HD superfamily hydrolase